MNHRSGPLLFGSLAFLFSAVVGAAQELNTAQTIIKDVILGGNGSPVIDPGSGSALVSQGSWTKPGGSYRDPLSGRYPNPSDHDLRCVVPKGASNAEALQIYNQTRARVAARVEARFGANAGKVLESINIYPPEQLMAGVTTEAEAITRFEQLGIRTPNLGGAPPEGLWTSGRFSFARAYERSTGRIFFNVNGKMQAGYADILSDIVVGADDVAVFTLEGASQNAAAFAEKVAHAVEAGKPEDVIKNLQRTRSMLGKSYGLSQTGGSASYLDDLIAKAKGDPFPLLNPSLRQEIIEATKRAALEARLLEQLKSASAVDKEIITRWVQEINAGGTTGEKIVKAFGKVPFDKIALGLRTVFAFYQGYVIAGKVDEGDMEGALREAGTWAAFEALGFGPGMAVMMAGMLIEQAKSFGYDLVAQAQSSSDLLAGIFTVKGREVNILDSTVRPLTVDDLATLYQRPSQVESMVAYRAHVACARGLGEATGKSDKEVEKQINERCGKEILDWWEKKRDDLDREVLGLHNALSSSPVVIAMDPEPAVFEANQSPFPLRATLHLPQAEIKTTERKIGEILTKLAGKSQYAVMIHYTWQVDGVALKEDADRSTVRFRVDKAGSHTVFGEVRIQVVCGENYRRVFPALKKSLTTQFDVTVKTTPGGGVPPAAKPKGPAVVNQGAQAGKYLANLRWSPAPPTTRAKTQFRVDVKNPPPQAKYYWYIGKEPVGLLAATAVTDEPTLLYRVEKAGRQKIGVKLFDMDNPENMLSDEGLDVISAEMDVSSARIVIKAPAAVLAGDHFNASISLPSDLAPQIKGYEWEVFEMDPKYPEGIVRGSSGSPKTASPQVTLQADPVHAGKQIRVRAKLEGLDGLDPWAAESAIIEVKTADVAMTTPAGWTRKDMSFERDRVEKTFPAPTPMGLEGKVSVRAYVTVSMANSTRKETFPGTAFTAGKYRGCVQHEKKDSDGALEHYAANGGMQYDSTVLTVTGFVEGRADGYSEAAKTFNLAECARADQEMMQIIKSIQVTPHEQYTNVTAQLTVVLEPEKKTLTLGDVVKVYARISGGTEPYKVVWTGDHGKGADPTEVLFTARQPGEHRLSVAVTDVSNRTASASVTLALDAYKVSLSLQGAAKVTLGDSRTFTATVKSGDAVAVGKFEYQWQPHPEVSFEPHTSPQNQTTAKFTQPGRVKVWVAVLEDKGGRKTTVAESEQVELEVVEPGLKLVANPLEPLVGATVKARVETDGETDDAEITYWWEIKGNTLNAGPLADEHEYTYVVKDTAPVVLTVHAKAKRGGAELGKESVTVKPKQYTVAIGEPRLQGPPPRVWDPRQGGLVEVPRGIPVYGDFFLKATITPPPEDVATLRYQWTVSPEGCLVALPYSQETRGNAKQAGSYTFKVTIRNADGGELGSATRDVSVIEGADPAKVNEAAAKQTQAKQLYAQGKLDEAINMAQSAATLNAKDAGAAGLVSQWTAEKQTVLQQLQTAQKLAAANQLPAAFAALGEARKLQPKYQPVVQAEILLNDQQAKVDALRAAADEAVRKDKEKESDRLWKEGLALDTQGQNRAALARFLASLKVKETPERAEFARKYAAWLDANAQKAKEIIDKSVAPPVAKPPTTPAAPAPQPKAQVPPAAPTPVPKAQVPPAAPTPVPKAQVPPAAPTPAPKAQVAPVAPKAPPAAVSVQQPPPATAAPRSLTGVFRATIQNEGETLVMTLTLRQDGTRVTGNMTATLPDMGAMNEAVNATLRGNQLVVDGEGSVPIAVSPDHNTLTLNSPDGAIVFRRAGGAQ